MSIIFAPGNLRALQYPVDTRLRTEVVMRYLDSLTKKYGYGVSRGDWLRYDKLVDLDTIYHKRIYFRENPEEMYLLSFGGELEISDVFVGSSSGAPC